MKLDDVELGGRPGSVAGEVRRDRPERRHGPARGAGVADEETNGARRRSHASRPTGRSCSRRSRPRRRTNSSSTSRGSPPRSARWCSARRKQLDGIEVVMREGDGVISGHVDSAAGPLGGVTIEATDGTITVSTVSLTLDDVGLLRPALAADPGPVHRDVRARGLQLRDPDVRSRRRTAARRGGRSRSPRRPGRCRGRSARRRRPARRSHRDRVRARRPALHDHRQPGRRRPATRSPTCPRRRPTRSRSPSPGLVGQTRLEDLDPQRRTDRRDGRRRLADPEHGDDRGDRPQTSPARRSRVRRWC